MTLSRRSANSIFAGTIAVLVGCSVFSWIAVSRQPAIAPPSPSRESPGDAQLPADHPPIDSARELMALEELSRNAPDNAEYKTKIGNIYYDLGQYRRAIEAYEASLKLRPRDANVETDLATCFHRVGEHDRALEILQKVLGYSPGFAQALMNKGVILYVGKKDRQGALVAWEELLRVAPDLPQRAELEARIRELKGAGTTR